MSRALLLLIPTILGSATLPPVDGPRPLQCYQVVLTGKASYYHLPGRVTASGVKYGGMTAAHRRLPFGSVRTLCNGPVCCKIMVIDRFGKDDPLDRDWDVSKKVARQLGMLKEGVVTVEVR